MELSRNVQQQPLHHIIIVISNSHGLVIKNTTMFDGLLNENLYVKYLEANHCKIKRSTYNRSRSALWYN